jgi:hypothetical protein
MTFIRLGCLEEIDEGPSRLEWCHYFMFGGESEIAHVVLDG